MTEQSTGEQASAGLDRLSPEQLARFTVLNDAYRAKFSFPFIIAVRGLTAEQIAAEFQRRLELSPESEFAQACVEIETIALLRLKDILPD